MAPPVVRGWSCIAGPPSALRAALGIVLCLGGATACKVGEPLEVPALQAQLPTAPSFGVGSAREVEEGWLASFGDAKLLELTIEALENNPDLQASAARVEAAAGYARQAGALLAPTVALGAAGYDANAAGGGSGSGAALQLSWEADIWGRLDAQSSAAENQYMAAELMHAYARQSLAAQVAKSWFFCIEIREQNRIAAEAVALYERSLTIVDAMFEQGLVARDNVHLARADLASAEEALREASGAQSQAKRALEVLLGRYPSSELEVTGGFAELAVEIPVGLPTELLERRADIVAAERRVASAFQATRSAQAARLPRVSITAQAGATSSEFNALGDPGNTFWNLGANMLVPLFDGGFLESEEDIASAEQKAAVAEYRAAGLQAFADVENALVSDRLLRERETFLVTALDENTKAWELSKAQFDGGEIDFLSVLQLQRRVLNARVALVDIRGRQRAQRVDLHLSLGGNFESEAE